MPDIHGILKDANLESEFHVWSGQCLSIAKAIHDHFGGRIVFVSELPSEGFDHALVEIDDRLYDGSGQVMWTETVSRFVPREARCEDVDEHFYYPEAPFSQFNAALQPTVSEAAYEQIADALDARDEVA